VTQGSPPAARCGGSDPSLSSRAARLSGRADAAFADDSDILHNVFVHLYFLRDFVRPGGLVILDDTDWPSVATAVRYFELNAARHPEPTVRATRLLALRSPDPSVEPLFEDLKPFETRVALLTSLGGMQSIPKRHSRPVYSRKHQQDTVGEVIRYQMPAPSHNHASERRVRGLRRRKRTKLVWMSRSNAVGDQGSRGMGYRSSLPKIATATTSITPPRETGDQVHPIDGAAT